MNFFFFFEKVILWIDVWLYISKYTCRLYNMWVMLLCNKKNEERIKIENKFLVAWGSSRTKTRGWRLALGRLGALCEQVCYFIEWDNGFCFCVFFFSFWTLLVSKWAIFTRVLKIKIILKQSHNNRSCCGC